MIHRAPVDGVTAVRLAHGHAQADSDRARAEADRAAARHDRDQARADARAAAADAHAARADALRASADGLESGVRAMREMSINLQNPAYRAQLIAEARTEGRTVTDSELQAGIARFATVAETTAAKARQLRQRSESGSDR